MTIVAVLTVGAVAGFMAQLGGNEGSEPSGPPVKVPATIFYATHSPITISGNGGFTNASGVVWGSGTASDPYIIADWDINASSANGIDISDSSVYFIIRNCYIHDGLTNGHYGVSLDNVANGSILGNILSVNWFGIYLYSSNAIIISNNTCSEGNWGMLMTHSRHNMLGNNTCAANFYEGIVLDTMSNNNVMSDNNCSDNNDDGIFLDSASNNTLINNNCSNGDYGIILTHSGSYNNTLIDNNCSSHTYDGMLLSSSGNNTLINNTCSWNLQWGIEVQSSSNNSMVRNNCSANGNDGIYLGASSDNNTLVSNSGFSNAYNGIDIVSSRDNIAVSNTWSSNGYDGAYVGFSTNNTLDSNNCSWNSRWGIQIRDSNGTVLLRNQLCNNFRYGVYIYSASSSSNVVFNNTFTGNNGAGSTYDLAHIQAYDEGTGNWWNSTDGYGNYWSDWTTPDVVPPYGIVDQPYVVDGSGGAEDYYPQTSPLAPIPEFSAMPFVAIVLLAAILLAARRKNLQETRK